MSGSIQTFHWHRCITVWRIFAVLTLLLSGAPSRSLLQQIPDTDQSQWTDQLIRHAQDAHASNVESIRTHPDETYNIVKSHWSEISNFGDKTTTLVAFREAQSPRLFDLLDLAIKDDNTGTQYAAREALFEIAFRRFEEDQLEDYSRWRDSVSGLSQEQVIRREETDFFQCRLAAAPPDERADLLWSLMRVDFSSSLTLARLRRSVASDCGALDVLARLRGETGRCHCRAACCDCALPAG